MARTGNRSRNTPLGARSGTVIPERFSTGVVLPLPGWHNPEMGNRYRVSPDTNIYFTTSTLVWWTPVFISSKTCDILCDSLNFCREKKGLRVHGYVIMPTHFHAILSTEDSADLSSVLRDLKRHTSQTLLEYFENSEWRLPLRAFEKAAQGLPEDRKHKVWEESFHPKGLFTPDAFRQKLEYIHSNPVRKGLVSEASHWVYSSARFYETGEEGPVTVDWVEI